MDLNGKNGESWEFSVDSSCAKSKHVNIHICNDSVGPHEAPAVPAGSMSQVLSKGKSKARKAPES